MTKFREAAQGHFLNRELLFPYALPYLAYVGIASLGSGHISDEVSYILKIILVPGLLIWAWKWYMPLTGPKNTMVSAVYGVLFGIIGLIIWCLLMAPFIDPEAEAWSGSAFWLRLFSATLIVPVFEELLMRGYILKLAYQWDINRKDKTIGSPLKETMDHNSIDTVQPGAWSIMAVVISTIAFTAGHLMIEWPAAIAYSLLMSLVWIIRKDLISCMVAHGTTNLGLALYVYYSGHWGFW